jgi:uncharacterized protein with LGFP repeats
VSKNIGRIRRLAAASALLVLLAGSGIPAAAAAAPLGMESPSPTVDGPQHAVALPGSDVPSATLGTPLPTATPTPTATDAVSVPDGTTSATEAVPTASATPTTSVPQPSAAAPQTVAAVPTPSASASIPATESTSTAATTGFEPNFAELAALHSLGLPSSPINCGLVGGGCQQDFAVATIYRTPAGEFRLVANPVRSTFWANAGQGGSLGYPTTDQQCGLARGACIQGFVGGDIYITPATGTHAITGAILTMWRDAGGENSELGYPTSKIYCGLIGGGCQQDFQGGSAYVTPSKGTFAVVGSYRGVYWAKAGQGGALAYPVAEKRCGLVGGGCQQDFQGGTIYFTPAGGTFAVQGALRDMYWAEAGQGGSLGYPKANHACGLIGGGCQQDFDGGTVYLTPASGTHSVLDPIRSVFWTKAGQGGALGYPTTDRRCGLVGGGCIQDFQGGSVYETPIGGVIPVQGALRASYWAAGGHGSALGFPTGEQVCGLPGNGCQQNFQGGTVSLTGSSSAVISSNPFSSRWLELGGVFGYLGYPVDAPRCGFSNNGCKQAFQAGAVVSGPPGVYGVGGAIAVSWAAASAQEGRYGYPTAPQTCSGGYCSQAFQGGVISTAPPAAPAPAPAPTPGVSNYAGFGRTVIPISKPGGARVAAVATLTHNGRSNFIVKSLDASYGWKDTLVNEIGQYGGTVLFDESNWKGTDTVYLDIQADGAWSINISTVESVPRFDGSFEVLGKGDAVLYYTGGPRAATLFNNGLSNFIIWAYGRDETDLVVNEIGRYSAVVPMIGPALYEVSSSGTWSILMH